MAYPSEFRENFVCLHSLIVATIKPPSTMEENKLTTYKPAADTIKLAILQGQYEAAKGVNRIQLAVYFSIGKYISLNTRKGKWGTGALEAISQILRKELPGLRGFSATNLKNMRLFYEAWTMLDASSSATADEIQLAECQAVYHDLWARLYLCRQPAALGDFWCGTFPRLAVFQSRIELHGCCGIEKRSIQVGLYRTVANLYACA